VKSCVLRAVPPQIVRPVLSQSKYKNLLPLFVARNILLVSPETKAKEMLRVLKGAPQINLLGESLPCVRGLGAPIRHRGELLPPAGPTLTALRDR